MKHSWAIIQFIPQTVDFSQLQSYLRFISLVGMMLSKCMQLGCNLAFLLFYSSTRPLSSKRPKSVYTCDCSTLSITSCVRKCILALPYLMQWFYSTYIFRKQTPNQTVTPIHFLALTPSTSLIFSSTARSTISPTTSNPCFWASATTSFR